MYRYGRRQVDRLAKIRIPSKIPKVRHDDIACGIGNGAIRFVHNGNITGRIIQLERTGQVPAKTIKARNLKILEVSRRGLEPGTGFSCPDRIPAVIQVHVNPKIKNYRKRTESQIEQEGKY